MAIFENISRRTSIWNSVNPTHLLELPISMSTHLNSYNSFGATEANKKTRNAQKGQREIAYLDIFAQNEMRNAHNPIKHPNAHSTGAILCNDSQKRCFCGDHSFIRHRNVQILRTHRQLRLFLRPAAKSNPAFKMPLKFGMSNLGIHIAINHGLPNLITTTRPQNKMMMIF